MEELKRKCKQAIKLDLKSSMKNFTILLIVIIVLIIIEVILSILSLDIISDTIIDTILEIVILFFTLNLISFIIAPLQEKKIFNYLAGKKQFNYQSYTLSKEKFNQEITTGLLPMYIKYKNKIFYFEVQIEKSKNNISKQVCYVNFDKIEGIDNFQNFEIEGKKIKDFETFEVIAYNYNNPKNYFN